MSNLNELTPIQSLSPFKRFCCTIGNLPSSYVQSLSFEELIYWFCDYLQNTVIPATNNNAYAIQELQNYFSNLNVQEEINNKLDEMAESGELADIIAGYLQLQGLLCYNTINDMKNAQNISNGSFAKTFGKLTYNDGMGEFYKIRNITNDDLIDEINIIKIIDSDTLIAELIPNKTINDILTDISLINNSITDLNNNKISSIYGASSSTNLVWHQYFVDNTDGDDTNDGSQATPFKTLEPIINMINKGKLKVDIALKRGQTHILPSKTFNSCVIHLEAYGTGTDKAIVTTNTLPSANSSLPFYNCHGNFKNINFTNIGYDMYFDGGSFVAQDCIFDCKVTSWGCGCRFNNCTIKTLKARMCNIWVENNSIIGCIDSKASVLQLNQPIFNPSFSINHEDTSSCYAIEGGVLSIWGVTQILTDDNPALNRLFWFTGLCFLLSSAPNVSVQGLNFSSSSHINCCKVVATTARLSTLYDSANGIEYGDGTEYPQ